VESNDEWMIILDLQFFDVLVKRKYVLVSDLSFDVINSFFESYGSTVKETYQIIAMLGFAPSFGL